MIDITNNLVSDIMQSCEWDLTKKKEKKSMYFTPILKCTLMQEKYTLMTKNNF